MDEALNIDMNEVQEGLNLAGLDFPIDQLPALDTTSEPDDPNSILLFNTLDPRTGYLQCQLDQIYEHKLGEDCRANVKDLPYDYRTVVKDYFGFNHKHGVPDSAGFDEHGHFGNFDNEYAGNVIHYVSGEFDMIYDEKEEEVKSDSNEQSQQEQEATQDLEGEEQEAA